MSRFSAIGIHFNASNHRSGCSILIRDDGDVDRRRASSRNYTPAAIIAVVGLLLEGVAFPNRADAYDLGKALAGTPEAKLTSTKPVDQVERCIFISDLAAPPIAYRSPDGTRSLIHGGRSQPIFAFELLRSSTGTDVIVWQGKGYVAQIKLCL